MPQDNSWFPRTALGDAPVAAEALVDAEGSEDFVR
jgi:hypothetical protein